MDFKKLIKDTKKQKKILSDLLYDNQEISFVNNLQNVHDLIDSIIDDLSVIDNMGSDKGKEPIDRLDSVIDNVEESIELLNKFIISTDDQLNTIEKIQVKLKDFAKELSGQEYLNAKDQLENGITEIQKANDNKDKLINQVYSITDEFEDILNTLNGND